MRDVPSRRHRATSLLSHVLAPLAAGALALAALLLPTPGRAEESPSAAALAKGEELLQQEDHKGAIKAFKQADKLAGGSCAPCQLGLARAFNRVGAHKDALKSAAEVLRLSDDPDVEAAAYNQQGIALTTSANGDAARLGEAEQAFRKVLEIGGERANAARYNLGEVLLQLERDAEGVEMLKQYLEREPNGQFAERSRQLVENPLRARKTLAPELNVATLAGEYLTSEGLRGKVVLLDFWATWCAPCVAALPSLRAMTKRWEGEPFVLLSISVDTNGAALKDFIARKQMTWPQVWDDDHEIARECGVNSFPTYLVVSHDGEVVYGTRGWGQSIERELHRKTWSAIQAAKKAVKTAG